MYRVPCESHKDDLRSFTPRGGGLCILWLCMDMHADECSSPALMCLDLGVLVGGCQGLGQGLSVRKPLRALCESYWVFPPSLGGTAVGGWGRRGGGSCRSRHLARSRNAPLHWDGSVVYPSTQIA